MKPVLSCNGCVTFNFRPVGQSNPILTTDAIVLKQISNLLPRSHIDCKFWEIIKTIRLADSNFNKPSPIDVLLGADVFSKVLINGSIPAGNLLKPDAINTIFGFVLTGKIPVSFSHSLQIYFCHTVALKDILQQFWEIENISPTQNPMPDDQFCEKHFIKTRTQADDNKYIVSLPFKYNKPSFSGIRDLTVNRFLSLERCLLQQPQLYSEYSQFMKEYLNLGNMEFIIETEIRINSYYIPHHCILRPESSTTALRVVFNESAHLPNQPSLNDTLFKGPKLQPDILKIFLQFRLHYYVLCADMKMMYRNIWVNPAQCDYQRIVYRFSPTEPIQDFRLLTVVYGLNSSPFLALRS